MFASRPAGRMSTSDGHSGSEPEEVPESDPDRRRFLKVGGRVTVVDEEGDEERVNTWDVVACNKLWAGGKTCVPSLKRLCISAVTDRPGKSV
jgi:hypothetical protein